MLLFVTKVLDLYLIEKVFDVFQVQMYSEYLYLYLQIWKSTCTWLKYFEKYSTPTLVDTFTYNLNRL